MTSQPKLSRAYVAFIWAFIWGWAWAAYLQYTRTGRWLAYQRTWLTVVVGVGGDLLIALWCVERKQWLRIAVIIAASSIGIIVRSLYNEYRDA